MTMILWQQNSNQPDDLAQIRSWWSSLEGQEISLAQRLVPDGRDEDISWERQRFDEQFVVQMPQLRGITLYWFKPDSDVERSVTPRQLELDTVRQKLYIYPQSQPQVVVRVGLAEVTYQTLELRDPQIASLAVGEDRLLLLRDRTQQLEIKVHLSPQSISLLREKLI